MPFTVEQFFGVFREYNEAFWPLQLVLWALGLAAVGLLFARRPAAGWLIPAILSALWAWMAVAYHFLYFTRINPAAWAFGSLFLVEAALFAWMGLVRRKLRFTVPPARGPGPARSCSCMRWSLYPLLGALLGHAYMESPTFGLPCPTTLFTLGLLLLLRRPFPRLILVVPLSWAVVGTLAALRLNVPQDFGLLAAGLAGLALAFAPHRRTDAGSLTLRETQV